MLKLFCPKLYIKNIYDLDMKYLKQKNIKSILIDLDNTLLPWDSFTVETQLTNWIKRCKDEGFSLCIISNNRSKRILRCAQELEIPAVTRAFKPRKKAFKKGLVMLGAKPENTAVIGDQIFTDILGANRMGMFSILVEPIGVEELWWTKIIRRIERILLKKMERENLLL